jgi:hypothetical protein
MFFFGKPECDKFFQAKQVIKTSLSMENVNVWGLKSVKYATIMKAA